MPVHGRGLRDALTTAPCFTFPPQLEGLFLSSLLLQMQKVNHFFIEKSNELGSHLHRCEQP